MARASKAYDVFFSGCSWLAMYHVGVAAKLVEKKVRIRSFAGASSGSLIAVALASGVKPECLRRSISHLAKVSNFLFESLACFLRLSLTLDFHRRRGPSTLASSGASRPC